MPTDKQVEAAARYLAELQKMNPDTLLSAEEGWPTSPKKGEKGIPLWKKFFESKARELLRRVEVAEPQ